jgi:ACS family sodium-dependent inorganic phosphate cotransporter
LAALPPLARLLAGFGFGAIGDYLRGKNIFQVTTIRKSFCLFCK